MKIMVVAIAIVVAIIGILVRFSYYLFGIFIPYHRILGLGVIALAIILFIYGLVAKTSKEKA